jgi:hypothetical protein
MVLSSQSLRRLVTASALSAALLASAPLQAEVRAWNFRVFLDDAEIGYHRFTLRQGAGGRELTSEARFDVKFLFLTAYRYQHEAIERWRGDCLAAVAARTNDNGELYRVEASRVGERFVVETQAGRDELAGCVMTFAYWNPRMLRQTRLLNVQTGEYANVTVTPAGEELIPVRGQPTSTRRYALRGEKIAIDLWYSLDNDWLALESTTSGGRRVRYQIN